MVITNTTFLGNGGFGGPTSGCLGGALNGFAQSGVVTSIAMTNVSFINNFAGGGTGQNGNAEGGAIFANGLTVSCSGCVFDGNIGWIRRTSSLTFAAFGSTFQTGLSGGEGGAVCIDGSLSVTGTLLGWAHG